MANQNDYIISIKGGGKNREINLSSGTFKFGVASVVLGAIIFVGSCGYSVYSALYKQRNADSVSEVQKANEIQQEQLLTISKKADEMNEKLQDLARQEEALRLQAGLKPPKEDPDDAEKIPEGAEENSDKHTGQGGPIAELEISEVSEALDIIERRVTIRKESLDAFQNELQERSANWAKKNPVGNSTSGSYSGSSGWVLPVNGGNSTSFSRPAVNSVPSTSQNIDWRPQELSLRLMDCVGAAVIFIQEWTSRMNLERRLLQLRTVLSSLQVGTPAAMEIWLT